MSAEGTKWLTQRLLAELQHAGRSGLTHELCARRLGIDPSKVRSVTSALFYKNQLRCDGTWASVFSDTAAHAAHAVHCRQFKGDDCPCVACSESSDPRGHYWAFLHAPPHTVRPLYPPRKSAALTRRASQDGDAIHKKDELGRKPPTREDIPWCGCPSVAGGGRTCSWLLRRAGHRHRRSRRPAPRCRPSSPSSRSRRAPRRWLRLFRLRRSSRAFLPVTARLRARRVGARSREACWAARYPSSSTSSCTTASWTAWRTSSAHSGARARARQGTHHPLPRVQIPRHRRGAPHVRA